VRDGEGVAGVDHGGQAVRERGTRHLEVEEQRRNGAVRAKHGGWVARVRG
jgi:hypothetical protein